MATDDILRCAMPAATTDVSYRIVSYYYRHKALASTKGKRSNAKTRIQPHGILNRLEKGPKSLRVYVTNGSIQSLRIDQTPTTRAVTAVGEGARRAARDASPRIPKL